MNTHSALLVAGLSIAFAAHGQSLLVDRGLPNANLNNAAGTSRCNWTYTFGTDPDPSGVYHYLVADSFDLGDPYHGGPIKIDTIRLWVTPASDIVPEVYQLLLGTGADATLTVAASVAGGTTTTYAGGIQFETASGTLIDLLQLDFPVNRTFAPNTRVYFGLSGVGAGGAFAPPYVHGSNAALGGTPQQGSDDSVHWYYSADFAAWSYGGPFDTNLPDVNLSTDINVQVFGEPLWANNAGLSLALSRLAGLVELRIEGAQIGDTLAIQSSPDLVTWTTVETRPVDGAVEVYTDSTAAVDTRKFYRVVRTIAL